MTFLHGAIKSTGYYVTFRVILHNYKASGLTIIWFSLRWNDDSSTCKWLFIKMSDSTLPPMQRSWFLTDSMVSRCSDALLTQTQIGNHLPKMSVMEYTKLQQAFTTICGGDLFFFLLWMIYVLQPSWEWPAQLRENNVSKQFFQDARANSAKSCVWLFGYLTLQQKQPKLRRNKWIIK